MTAPAEPTALPPGVAPTPSVGLVLHQTGFVFNAALTGTLAGTLLALASGAVVFLRELANGGAGNLLVMLGMYLGFIVLGALVGTGLGLFAGLRALKGPVRSLPPLGAGLRGGALLALLGLLAGALAGALLAVAITGFQEVFLVGVIVLAVLCGPLGAVAAGHVGYGCPPGLRAFVFVLIGGFLGAIPGALLFTTLDLNAAARSALLHVGLTLGGSVGGILLAFLAEIALRSRAALACAK